MTTPSVPARHPLWRTPEDGPATMSLGQAENLMFGWHSESARIYGCGPHHWAECTTFALARIRGICHDWYIVVMPGTMIRDPQAPGGYAILDWLGDGPGGMVRAELTEGYTTFSAALEIVAAQAVAEHRNEETPIDVLNATADRNR